MDDNPLTEAIQYFLRHLEREAEIVKQKQAVHQPEEVIDFEIIERFFRTLKMQNIFIFVVGINGKPESSSLPKLIFSLSRVVRIYYSLSLDTNQAGFLRVKLNEDETMVLIERLHGYRPTPEIIYTSKYPCHIIRFITRWMLRRIDWNKTKLQHLEIYKQYVEARAEAIRLKKEQEMQSISEEPPLRLKDVLKKVNKERRNRKTKGKKP